ncbi:MAG: hypothetical protein ACQESR_23270 [Planctomycetota bacterium]
MKLRDDDDGEPEKLRQIHEDEELLAICASMQERHQEEMGTGTLIPDDQVDGAICRCRDCVS